MSAHHVSDLLSEVEALPLPAGSCQLLADYRARRSEGTCVYLSTPLTTGPLFVASRTRVPPSVLNEAQWTSEDRSKAFQYYVDQLRPIIGQVAARFPDAFIINPGDVSVDDWKQLDYHRFWIEVIRQFAEVMVMADGWHVSNGSSLEIAFALRRGLPVLDSKLNVLSVARAESLLESGLVQFEKVGLDTRFLRLAHDAVVGQR